MRTTFMHRWALPLSVAAGALAGPAVAATRQLSLTEPDEFVLRSVAVNQVDGKKLAGVSGIAGYDAASRSFRFETARGDVAAVAASMAELVFTQSVRRPAPQMQQCPWEIDATPGAVATAKVKADDFRIENGRLVLDDAVMQPPAAPGAIFEVQRIAYDRSADAFTVSLRAWRYEVRKLDCGSGSRGAGTGKAMQ